MPSGLWHHRQASGQPFIKTVVRMPGPSWMAYRLISNMKPVVMIISFKVNVSWTAVARHDLWLCPAFIYLVNIINPLIYFVIPAAAKRRAGIQLKPRYDWIAAFAAMTDW